MTPTDLTEEEATLWESIVASEPRGWFSEAMKPLLIQYCRHITAARTTAKLIQALKASGEKLVAESTADPMPGGVNVLNRLLKMQERESRAIASLATKMRITQQATINKRGNKIARKPPWDF